MLDKAFKRFLSSINQGSAPAWLQKGLWKGWYSLLARRWRDDGWTFMNYGWVPPDEQPQIELTPQDEPDRYFIGPYFLLAQLTELEGKSVLEVGSGRGGGASYLARYHQPLHVIGVDYSGAAVDLCRRLHAQVGQLSFQQGDAENLPFDDASFDILLNVESSHCYGNMARFVSEAARVLRPGGKFGWVDLRGPDMMTTTEQAFTHPALKLLHEQDITAQVVKALDAASERKATAINRLKVGGELLRQFSAMPGSALHKGLKSGRVRYLCRIYERS
ncbi:class I SAM-dependent methyltransferase [Nitrincola sp. MINF-07-Sa-05]|uniref:class I SAM-dependent methyltransferase n=1 Tax=Nitrincola salilacus TaxID=3400273 RepID=UPI003917DB0F